MTIGDTESPVPQHAEDKAMVMTSGQPERTCQDRQKASWCAGGLQIAQDQQRARLPPPQRQEAHKQSADAFG